MFTRFFPLWVSLCAFLALLKPELFTWFAGPWITYGLGGIMLGMGLTLKWSDFTQVLKTPSRVAFGMLLQFTVMPLLGWGLGILFELPPFFAVGLILVACCPGGTASNVIAYLAKANVALSVAMTTCSTLGAIILTPLLTASFSGSYLEVDAWGLFYSTLKVVLIPVTLGVILNQYLSKFTQKIIPYSPPAAVLLIVLIVASIIGQGKEIILNSGLNLIAAIMCLHFLGFLLGYGLCAIVFKDKAVSKTIAIEVGMQNSGLGAVLARENFTNPATAIQSALSNLVHSIYRSIFGVIIQKNKQ
ncbi:MAG: bile acid:sodium symporter family protein [Flavobacteriaceae bacterium]